MPRAYFLGETEASRQTWKDPMYQHESQVIGHMIRLAMPVL